MIKFVLLNRNLDKTRYTVRRHFNLFGIVYIPFGKPVIMTVNEITNKMECGKKFVILNCNESSKITTYETKNGTFIRSTGNNKPGDNVISLPVVDL